MTKSYTVQWNSSGNADQPSSFANSIHLLPCKIQHDGPAKVSAYFVVDDGAKTTTEVNAQDSNIRSSSCVDELTSTFRGRTLRGTRIPFPAQYRGVLMKRASRNDNLSEQAESSLDSSLNITYSEEGTFDDFIAWGHDEAPSKATEPVLRAMEYVAFANVLHSMDGN